MNKEEKNCQFPAFYVCERKTVGLLENMDCIVDFCPLISLINYVLFSFWHDTDSIRTKKEYKRLTVPRLLHTFFLWPYTLLTNYTTESIFLLVYAQSFSYNGTVRIIKHFCSQICRRKINYAAKLKLAFIGTHQKIKKHLINKSIGKQKRLGSD